jgi:type III pantothenate kinase
MVIKPLSRDRGLLVVEIGNTTTTCAVFHQEDPPVEVLRISTQSLGDGDCLNSGLRRLLGTFQNIGAAVLCSVVPTVSEAVSCMLRNSGIDDVLLISSNLKLPFELQYDNPESFGSDRIALCAAGRKLFPQRPLIALDIGTAVTVDVLSASGLYAGGFIMPGLDIMARSLHERTAQLPHVRAVHRGEFLGRSTASCIRNGIFWGCVTGIDGLTARIVRDLRDQEEEEPVVIVTGGSAPAIAPFLEREVLLLELAVARGARYLYELNASSV